MSEKFWLRYEFLLVTLTIVLAWYWYSGKLALIVFLAIWSANVYAKRKSLNY